MGVVVIRPPVWMVRMARANVPSFVVSSGKQEGGDGVTTTSQWARWTCSARYMRVLSLSEDEEGDGDGEREEMKIGEEGRDMLPEMDR